MRPGNIFHLLIILGLTAAACKDQGSKENPARQTDVIQAPQPDPGKQPDWEIVPGHRIGAIRAESSEMDLGDAYGAENISTRSMDEGEGNMVPTTLIYPGSKNEVRITWQDAEARKRPARVTINGEGSDWHIGGKIRIGTTLSQLEEWNGKSFFITGCCYDAPFAVVDWDKGRLEYLAREGAGIRLRPTKPTDELNDKIIGDKQYLITDSLIRNAGMRVSEFFIRFR